PGSIQQRGELAGPFHVDRPRDLAADAPDDYALRRVPGTTGTFVGAGRYLKGKNPEVRLVGVQPDGPFHGIDGVKHLESSHVPGIWDPKLPDEILSVATEDAQRAVRRLAREEGLLVGTSSGAA